MEAIIKIGGSLMEKPEALKALCNKLSEIAKKHRLLVVPGGGDFAEAVRQTEERFTLSPFVLHKMAILGMDQFGLMLSELIPDANAIASLERSKEYWKSKATSVFLPSKIMFRDEPLEASWDVTSDSIAAFVACRVKAEMLILAKDVDGIFNSDPAENPEARLITELTASALLKRKGKTGVDRYLPRLLMDRGINCYVVNGLFPERIIQVLEGKKTTCTLIASKKAICTDSLIPKK